MSDSHLHNYSKFIKATDHLIRRDDVRVALDLGSRDAEIACCMESTFPNAQVYAFECNPPALQLCRQNAKGHDRIKVVPKAVSDLNGEITFYAIDPQRTQTPHDDGNIGASSLYEASPDYPYEKYVQNKITVQSTTLYTWALAHGVASIDVIWADLQGAELKAFIGLKDAISSVKIIYTEVEYRPIYKGQPLAPEMHRFLVQNGFRPFKKFNTTAWSGDVLYYNTRHFKTAEIIMATLKQYFTPYK